MNKLSIFMKRKRNIYFSIILMLTVVAGLVSISFSYYVDESSKNGLVTINEVDNRIQSDSLKDGVIKVGSQESINFTVYVISNNNFDSRYEMYYQTKDSNVKVYTTNNITDTLYSHSVEEYNIVVENYNEHPVEVTIGVASSRLTEEIKLPGNKIVRVNELEE